MEYYIASLYNKNVRVYVDEKVDFSRGEYINYKQPENYQSRYIDDPERTLQQLGFINALGIGTWYSKYNSLDELKKYISSHFPKIK